MSQSKTLALFGGRPVGPITQPQFPVFSRRALARVTDALENGRTVGLNKKHPIIDRAEAALSRYHDGRTVMGTSSGHAALQAALIGVEVGPGDEVVTTPYTWGASISCILHQGAVPVFADVDPVTGLLDAQSVEACITPRTKAILVVHIYGQPANMTAIMAVAKKHDLAVVEDGSQAHGATWQGTRVGNFGDAAGFSCMGGKLLATTEAGYLVTQDEETYWRACLSTQHMGRSGDDGFPDMYRPYVDSLLHTFRLSTVNAILLEEQVKKLDREIEHRRRNVHHLRTCLADSKFVQFPEYSDDENPSYHIVTMNFNLEAAGISRDTFKKAVAAEGFGMASYVPAPISQWTRMQWQQYRGPKTVWTESLRRSGIDYAAVPVPNCEHKVERSLEFGCNFIRPAKRQMARIADIVYKVEANIDALRVHEKGLTKAKPKSRRAA